LDTDQAWQDTISPFSRGQGPDYPEEEVPTEVRSASPPADYHASPPADYIGHECEPVVEPDYIGYQLEELRSLFEAGSLSAQQYQAMKDDILSVLGI
jgi:hypothetical protein